MAEKKALQGLKGVKFFEVVKNDASEYKTGDAIIMPEVQEMTREPDVGESKIYADDSLYINFKSWNGINATITFAEFTLEQYELLGFGKYDKDKKELKWNPQGENKEFAVSFLQARADHTYLMTKLYSFTVNEIKETNAKSKGTGGDINAIQVIGTFSKRKADDAPGMMHDGTDAEWADTIDQIPVL